MSLQKIISALLALLIIAVIYVRSDVFVSIFNVIRQEVRVAAPEEVETIDYTCGKKSMVVRFYLVDEPARKIYKNFKDNGYIRDFLKSDDKSGSNFRKIIISGSGTYHHHTLRFIKECAAIDRVYVVDAHSDSRLSNKIDCGTWVNKLDKKVVFLGGYFGLTHEGDKWLNWQLLSDGQMDVYTSRKGRAYFKFDYRKSDDKWQRKVKWSRKDKIASLFGKPGVWVKWKSLEDFKDLKFKKREKSYLTIDLDVLSEKYVSTDWGNGSLRLNELLRLIEVVAEKSDLVCVDICGWSGKNEEKSLATIRKIYQKVVSVM